MSTKLHTKSFSNNDTYCFVFFDTWWRKYADVQCVICSIFVV